ncbi:MAG: bifunctional 5,10-methylenetetrahydrofolate dehydrogenase/5,10-methenyltetrahydrofolate cyclohydrolase [Candidatus Shapirobacteria bacterium]
MIINGKKWADEKEAALAQKIALFKKTHHFSPGLAVVLAGDDPASKMYVALKEQAAKRVGLHFEKHLFSQKDSLQLIKSLLQQKNNDQLITGILIQLPLQLIKPADLINQIAPQKDVDCLTDYNLSRLNKGQALFLPATLKAVLVIIKNFELEIKNSSVCVVGATGFIGKPIADYLDFLGAGVDRCDRKTADLSLHARRADILISASGVPGLIKKNMVKPGALVIDVGSPQGDVDFVEVKDVAGAITPVPGGVGPLTVVSLLENVFLAAQSTSI